MPGIARRFAEARLRGMQEFATLYNLREQIEARQRRKTLASIEKTRQYLGDSRNWAEYPETHMQNVHADMNDLEESLEIQPTPLRNPMFENADQAFMMGVQDYSEGKINAEGVAAFISVAFRGNDHYRSQWAMGKQMKRLMQDKEDGEAEPPTGERGAEKPARSEKTTLSETEEREFQQWYASYAQANGLTPDPDDHRHHYDYRGFWKANKPSPGAGGEVSAEDSREHLPDEWKLSGHPDAQQAQPANQILPFGEFIQGELERFKPKVKLPPAQARAWLNDIVSALVDQKFGSYPNPVIIASSKTRILREAEENGLPMTEDELELLVTQGGQKKRDQLFGQLADFAAAEIPQWPEGLAKHAARIDLQLEGAEITPQAVEKRAGRIKQQIGQGVIRYQRMQIVTGMMAELEEALAEYPAYMDTPENKGKRPGDVIRLALIPGLKEAFAAQGFKPVVRADELKAVNVLAAREDREYGEREKYRQAEERLELSRQEGEREEAAAGRSAATASREAQKFEWKKEERAKGGGGKPPTEGQVSKWLEVMDSYAALFGKDKEGELYGTWNDLTAAQKKAKRAEVEHAYRGLKRAGYSHKVGAEKRFSYGLKPRSDMPVYPKEQAAAKKERGWRSIQDLAKQGGEGEAGGQSQWADRQIVIATDAIRAGATQEKIEQELREAGASPSLARNIYRAAKKEAAKGK